MSNPFQFRNKKRVENVSNAHLTGQNTKQKHTKSKRVKYNDYVNLFRNTHV